MQNIRLIRDSPKPTNSSFRAVLATSCAKPSEPLFKFFIIYQEREVNVVLRTMTYVYDLLGKAHGEVGPSVRPREVILRPAHPVPRFVAELSYVL